MKYLDEFRNADAARYWTKAINRIVTRPWTIMEVCGGQTHAIVKHGLDQLLPDQVTLVHGPGCPVCVTPVGLIDHAIALALRPRTILCSFGDMMRVPGTEKDLLSAKAEGGNVRLIYSPMDALDIAKSNPDQEVVFFAVGFETTAPANAMAVYQARQQGIHNFSLLVSHVRVPPAIESILAAPNNKVQGFLLAGHVCTVMGWEEYEPLIQKYRIPLVVTGFEPVDILQGVYMCIEQLEQGRSEINNQYARAVNRKGNQHAQELIQRVFRITPRQWRGMGSIAESGLALTPDYKDFDAEQRFPVNTNAENYSSDCISGEILLGQKKPDQCSSFGTLCTPEKPLGAPMVSSEGACSAYYRYRKNGKAHDPEHYVG
jgi:hydrogenase expression/formation protein HypD